MFSDYEVRSSVSKNVFFALHKTTNKYVAIKRISCDKFSDVCFQKVIEEVKHVNNLQHKNIIKIDSVFVKDFDLNVVTSFFCFGSCKEAMKNFCFGFPEIITALILKDLLQAVDYLHSRGIIHR